jgi:Kef-type K+ transport system membrane component KefB
MQREYGPTIITVIVLGGFIGISFLAMKPELAGVKESVVLYLLGAWQSMAAAAVAYWIGSSSSSKQKDDTISSMSNTGASTK